MKMYKVELYLTDIEGEFGNTDNAKKTVKEMLEKKLQEFSAKVGSVKQTEIGEWHSEHRFGRHDTHIAEFRAAFGV